MDALLNLPTRDASNFAKYKHNSTNRQQLALHKQEGNELPRYQPLTILSSTSEPQVVGNERRNILLREFYALGLQRDQNLQPLKSAESSQQQAQLRGEPPPVSPKRQSQHLLDDQHRAKQQRVSAACD